LVIDHFKVQHESPQLMARKSEQVRGLNHGEIKGASLGNIGVETGTAPIVSD